VAKLLKSLVTVILLLASAYYIARLVSAQYQQIGGYLDLFTIDVLALALLCHLVGGIINATVWQRLLLAHDERVDFAVSFRAWAVSRLLRYIPGKVFGYAGRIYYQQASSKAGVVAAAISELVVSYLPILILALVSLVFYWQYFSEFTIYFASAIAMLAILLFSWPILLTRFWKFAQRFDVQKPASGSLPNARVTISCSGLAFLAMLIHGLSLYFLIDAVQPIDLSWYFFVVCAFYVSGVIGQLAVFVPAGIGVREASLAYFLSLIGVGPMAALVAVVISRLVIIASELINALLSHVLVEMRK